MIFVFIAFTSIGAGGLPPPANALRILLRPRYAAIAPTPAAAPPTQYLTLLLTDQNCPHHV